MVSATSVVIIELIHLIVFIGMFTYKDSVNHQCKLEILDAIRRVNDNVKSMKIKASVNMQLVEEDDENNDG